MLGVLSTNPPESVSTAVISSVLKCHDQGFYFLGGMLPDTTRMHPRVYLSSEGVVAHRIAHPANDVEITDGLWSETTFYLDPSPVAADPEPAAVEAGAVRHLGALMGRDRDGKMRYLSDAGLVEAEVAILIALVVRWLGEAGLDRLGDLSRMAVGGDLGPGHVLERWIDGRSKLDLVLLLDGAPISD